VDTSASINTQGLESDLSNQPGMKSPRKIHIAPYLLEMPQVRSITSEICDSQEFFVARDAENEDDSWTLAWGYPAIKRRFAIAETGFFWDAMHIDTLGLYQFSSLNSAEARREIDSFSAPIPARQLIEQAPLPKSKYRQPQEELEWNGVVFACQNPADRSVHSVASTGDWWRFYEESCRYYGSTLFVKLHPWNSGEIEQRMRDVAGRYGCTIGRAGHRVIETCEHVVLFTSTFSVDCMLRDIPVKQGAPGYFWQTGAVSYCAGDPRTPLEETHAEASQLVDFLAWRYCFTMDCSLDDWKVRLRAFANSPKLFPLEESQSYAAYLKLKCGLETDANLEKSESRGKIAARETKLNRGMESSSPNSERPLISFCTTCMGRLSYLCQTMPENIAANQHHFPQIEFILLDYNSRDGLREWVKTAMWEHVESDFLTVYSTSEPELYHSAHAKNLAHRVSRGELVCNLDADNYLVPGYVEFVWSEFARDPNQVFFGQGRDATGRITLSRRHFYEVGGYNEDMRGYGYDDVDLIRRASNHLSLRRHQVRRFNRYIGHSHEERIRHMEFDSINDSNMINRKLMDENFETGQFVANLGLNWGYALVQKNYSGAYFPCTEVATRDHRDSEQAHSGSRQAITEGIFSLCKAKMHHHHDEGLQNAILEVLPAGEPVLDLGCGTGGYLKALSKRGFDCLGVEGTPGIQEIAAFDNIVIHDLTVPLSIDWKPSSILCLEVAEHLPAEFEDQLVATIDRYCSGCLIVSWAYPGQPGEGHINCRPFEYVVRRFEAIGFRMNHERSEFLRSRSKKWWFRKNVTLFERD
jgi:hypothetical protein